MIAALLIGAFLGLLWLTCSRSTDEFQRGAEVAMQRDDVDCGRDPR